MHIIIDGYNLIRQSDTLRRSERLSLEAGRLALIGRMAEYKQKKNHKITIVFDGWVSGSPEEERDRQRNINIIYSRRGEKADDVIKRMIEKSMEEIIVVSSDREIASFALRRGKTALSSPEFEMLINKTIQESIIADYFPVDKDEEESERDYKKKGPARKLSKAQRQAQTKIRKL
jgi:hypothetical protein